MRKEAIAANISIVCRQYRQTEANNTYSTKGTIYSWLRSGGINEYVQILHP